MAARLPSAEEAGLRVAVTGSSGMIGTALGVALKAAGHEMVPMVRTPAEDGEAHWDPGLEIVDLDALGGVDAFVNLAGAPIADKPWKDHYKETVRDSRVRSTRVLSEAIASMSPKPRVLLSGSAVGYYGSRGDEVLTEASTAGGGFLAGVCEEWEAATKPAEDAGIRVAHLRTGVVLARHGGILRRMVPAFRFGMGGRLGKGRQWVSWITLADEVGAILHLLEDGGPSGPVNLTAPNPVTNAVLTGVLGRTLRRPAILHIPAFAVRAGMGKEQAEELLLASQRVLPKQLEASGYQFKNPNLRAALTDVLAQPMPKKEKSYGRPRAR